MALDLDAISEEAQGRRSPSWRRRSSDRDTEGQKRARAVKRLEVVEAFRLSQREQAGVDDPGRGTR